MSRFLGGRSDKCADLAGMLDEVAVYDRVLSEKDMTTHAAAGK